jgi:hypothetical protein
MRRNIHNILRFWATPCNKKIIINNNNVSSSNNINNIDINNNNVTWHHSEENLLWQGYMGMGQAYKLAQQYQIVYENVTWVLYTS